MRLALIGALASALASPVLAAEPKAQIRGEIDSALRAQLLRAVGEVDDAPEGTGVPPEGESSGSRPEEGAPDGESSGVRAEGEAAPAMQAVAPPTPPPAAVEPTPGETRSTPARAARAPAGPAELDLGGVVGPALLERYGVTVLAVVVTAVVTWLVARRGWS